MWIRKQPGSIRPSEQVTPVRTPTTPAEEDIDRLGAMIERLAVQLERANFAEYVQLMQRPRRILWLNFLGGMARGLGVAIGFTLITAALVYLLQQMTVLPYIGDFIADIVRIVNSHLETPTLP
ncbi:MAG: DUF5665 domain-containing protein [Tumebacillaceae bacterium]